MLALIARLRYLGLVLVAALLWVSLLLGLTYTVRAQATQQPTLTITELNAKNYPPQLDLTVQCSHLPATSTHDVLSFNVWDQVQNVQPITPPGISKTSIRVAVLLDITQHELVDDDNDALNRIITALGRFNDRCAWSTQDKMTAFAPARDNYAVPVAICSAGVTACWDTNRGQIVNQIRQYLAFPPENDRFTNLSSLIAQILNNDEFSPHPGQKNFLIVFSNGMSQNNPPLLNAQDLRDIALNGPHVTIIAVLLPDNRNQNSAYLRTLAGENYFELHQPSNVDPIWQMVGNPDVQFRLSYTTTSIPLFDVNVEVVDGTEHVITTSRTLATPLQPLALHIDSPRMGEVLTLTLSAASTMDKDNIPIHALPLTETLPVTAQVTIVQPAYQLHRKLDQLWYSVDSGKQLSVTLNSASRRLDLGELLPGLHTLSIQAVEAATKLTSTASAVFEIRPVVMRNGRALPELQRPYYSDLIASLQPISQTLSTQIKDVKDGLFGVSWSWRIWAVSIGALICAIIAFFYIMMSQYQKIKNIQHQLDNINQITWPPLVVTNWTDEKDEITAGLYLLSGSGLPEFIPIKKASLQIGSGKTSIGQNQNDVRLYNRYIEDRHCIIDVQPSTTDTSKEKYEFKIKAYDKQNGTTVNGKKLEPSDEPQVLPPGAIIQLGPFVSYKFVVKSKTHLTSQQTAQINKKGITVSQ